MTDRLHSPAPSAPTGSAASRVAAILAAGAAAGLLPFELPRGLNPPTLLPLGPTSTALVARTRRGIDGRAPKPSPAGKGGDTGPDAPLGPPGSVGVAGGGGAPGGASSALWCAILVGLLVYSAQELRRHRVRLALSGPVGVVSLLQRPG